KLRETRLFFPFDAIVSSKMASYASYTVPNPLDLIQLVENLLVVDSISLIGILGELCIVHGAEST
ncbi:hypothetical protein Tco_1140743, partial [Tanacetum coccineum]